MDIIDKNTHVWGYLTDELKGLVSDGELLISHAQETPERHKVSDYSYLVFPFAKAYEGFLKKLFLDLKVIKESDYYGDEIRIGKLLNPYYRKKDSVYGRLCADKRSGKELAERLWAIWRKGRNQVFHYYPHNFRRLTYNEAMDIVLEFVDAMYAAVSRCEI